MGGAAACPGRPGRRCCLHGTEKTGRLPWALTTDGVPGGSDPEMEEIGYYAPGQDLVLYYGDVGYFSGIIRIGRSEPEPGQAIRTVILC